SPLFGYEAGADPTVRAGTNGMFYYSGIVFNRTVEAAARRQQREGGLVASRRTSHKTIAAGSQGPSAVFIARFIDNNNRPGADPIDYIDATIIKSSPGTTFLDKPWLAVDLPRTGAVYCAKIGRASCRGR